MWLLHGRCRPYTDTLTCTPAGISRLNSFSIVACGKSLTSMSRLCVLISKCSRAFLLTCGEVRTQYIRFLHTRVDQWQVTSCLTAGMAVCSHFGPCWSSAGPLYDSSPDRKGLTSAGQPHLVGSDAAPPTLAPVDRAASKIISTASPIRVLL